MQLTYKSQGAKNIDYYRLALCFPRSRNPWPKQLNCPSQWFSRAAEAITPDCHCLGQCLFRWVNIGILICSLNQVLNRPMEGKFSDLTQRLLTDMLSLNNICLKPAIAGHSEKMWIGVLTA